jgi:hypothetical protein
MMPPARHSKIARFVLGKAQVSVLTLYISDEPADVVRELGVFLPHATRPRMLPRSTRGAMSRSNFGRC